MNKKKTSKKIVPKKNIAAVSAKDYAQTLLNLKKQIQEAQIRATMSVNKELISFTGT